MVLYQYRTIFILAASVFALMNTEVGVIGALPSIKEAFCITSSQAGYLVSIYAFVVAFTGPFVVLLMSRLKPKVALSCSVGVFFLSSLVSIFSTNYLMLMISRIFPAFFNAVIWSVSLTVAAGYFPPEKRGRASSLVGIGFISALIFGVPLTSFFAENYSWKVAFIFCAILNGIIFISALFFLPAELPTQPKIKTTGQLELLRKKVVWFNLFTTFFVYSGLFASYSFIKEYLITVSGFEGSFTTLLLFLFGVVGVIGNDIIGRLIRDDNMIYTMFLFLLSYFLMYFISYGFAFSQGIMMIVIFIWGILFNAGLTVVQVWGTMNMQEAPEFGNSLHVSSVNLGIAIGTLLGGISIDIYGVRSISLTSMFFVMGAFIFYIRTLFLKGHQQSLLLYNKIK